MNLPDLYARVVAKKPDLAVDSLEYHDDQGVAFWTLDLYGLELEDDDPAEAWKDEDETTKGACSILPNQAAAALILARWVEALPVRHSLDHHPASNRESEEWQVRWYTDDRRPACGPCATTPLEALAAFYLDANP